MEKLEESDVNDFPDFCSEMRMKTKNIHDQSDKLINLRLAAVLTDTKLWSEALADFYFIFRTIELALERTKDDPRVGALYFCSTSDHRRTDAFEADLQFYLGDDWRKNIRPSDIASAYCARIEEITYDSPILLIAYVHSMYLALLAGGQMLKKIVKKTLGLSGNDGLAIFDFSKDNRTELRSKILDAVNNIQLDQSEKDSIIAEKITVFKMNNAIANNFRPSWKNYQRLLKLFAVLAFVVCLTVYGIYILFSMKNGAEF